MLYPPPKKKSKFIFLIVFDFRGEYNAPVFRGIESKYLFVLMDTTFVSSVMGES